MGIGTREEDRRENTLLNTLDRGLHLDVEFR